MRTGWGVPVRAGGSLTAGLCGRRGALQFGGTRTYGYGTTRFTGTQLVDLDALDYLN